MSCEVGRREGVAQVVSKKFLFWGERFQLCQSRNSKLGVNKVRSMRRGREQGRPVISEGQGKGWGELRAQGQDQVSLPPLSNSTALHAILHISFLDFPGKAEMK